MRFSFSATHANEFRITTMCRVLQVSKAGYYAWVQRPQSARGVEDAAFLTRIETVFAASHQTYGSPRVHAELVATGEAPSVHGVARIMRTAGLRATRPRRFQVTTDSNHPYPIVPNVLDRQFGIDAVPALNRVWIGDITYISTLEVWLYLAVVLDLRSRRVIGWAMRHTLEGAITRDALAMALQDRRPAAGCLSPSDRGSPGGFNRSSQHQPVTRVSDDANKTTTCNEEHPEDAPFAGTATGRTTRGSRAILGRHSARTLSGGRGRRGAGVLGGGRPLVATSWGYATNPVGPIRPAALWALPILRRARAAGAPAHPSGHARRRPNWRSWLKAVIDALASTGLDWADMGEMLSVPDGYTRGASDTALSTWRAPARAAHPMHSGPPRTREESFAFGLARVLDGIERYVTAATP